MSKLLKFGTKPYEIELENLLKKRKFDSSKVDNIAKKIIKDVMKKKDKAVMSYTKKFDKFSVKSRVNDGLNDLQALTDKLDSASSAETD